MGLDCPNARRVIHWGASNDIESYMRETGRAGGDGLAASAILDMPSHTSNTFQYMMTITFTSHLHSRELQPYKISPKVSNDTIAEY
jgi:superfamily II DNA helicase RecQ